MVRTCEKEFQIHHGGFVRRLGAVRGLTNKILEKHSIFDKEIVSKFITAWTYARSIYKILFFKGIVAWSAFNKFLFERIKYKNSPDIFKTT